MEVPFKDYASLRNTADPAYRLAPGAPTSKQHFSTKFAYSKLLEKRHLLSTVEPRILNHGVTKEDIQDVYFLPFRILREAKLRIFQLKIIHGIFPTQSNLFRAGLTDSGKCPLCNLVIASLADHMPRVNEILGPFYSLVADNFSPKYIFIRKK